MRDGGEERCRRSGVGGSPNKRRRGHEEVRWSKAANRFQGSRAIGGKLFLTDRRVLFNPHLVDGATGGKRWSAALDQVSEVTVEPKGSGEGRRFGGGLRGRLKLVMRDGNEELFVINQLDEVADRLGSAVRGGR